VSGVRPRGVQDAVLLLAWVEVTSRTLEGGLAHANLVEMDGMGAGWKASQRPAQKEAVGGVHQDHRSHQFPLLVLEFDGFCRWRGSTCCRRWVLPERQP